jgi:DNA transformation protein
VPLSPGYLDRVLSELHAARPVTSRKMFGGAGFYLDGVFFAVADDDKLFFKVDGQTVEAYEDLGMGPWMMAGELNSNYREVPPSIQSDPDQLGEWIDAAAAVAIRKKKK